MIQFVTVHDFLLYLLTYLDSLIPAMPMANSGGIESKPLWNMIAGCLAVYLSTNSEYPMQFFPLREVGSLKIDSI